ncbi:MAG TPA: hypothetical protein PK671_02780, partial [Candidatus Obscuribacter sp.]|nr:hypothetical protein [Candidatus Obscuribacter sp.]
MMEATGMEQSQQKRQYREVLLLFLLFPLLVFFRLCHGPVLPCFLVPILDVTGKPGKPKVGAKLCALTHNKSYPQEIVASDK